MLKQNTFSKQVWIIDGADTTKLGGSYAITDSVQIGGGVWIQKQYISNDSLFEIANNDTFFLGIKQ